MSSIHEYLPETLKDVIDLKLLNEDLDIELEQLDGYITGIGNEVIVKSASLYGIEKWEKALGITPKDGDSLETRRFRINNLLTSKLPYTYRWLIKKLTQITGSPSGYTLNINQDDYAITIVLSGLDTNMMIEVQKQLRNAVPSNMVLEIGGPPLVSADIKVGTALRIGTKYIIKSAKTGLPGGKNLFDKEAITDSGKYLMNNGLMTGSLAFAISDYIPIQPNTSYVSSGFASGSGSNPSRCYYDENKTFISGTKHSAAEAIIHTSPAGAYYMRESVKVADLNTIQIEQGSTATDYEPFIEL